MSKAIIKVDNISKQYFLGQNLHGRGARTFRDIFDYKIKNFFSKNNIEREDSNKSIWALKEISFKVEEGEVIGIIGRNGAGKSTLLKILSRITLPTCGKITLNGRVASLLEVGTGFNPELTGRENIFLNGSILGMKKNEILKKFDEIVEFAEINKFIDTPVKRYSSGMYVRLAFSVAAHLEPEILIVDEVLSVGDSQFQKKCIGIMGDASSKEGKTVLFVSHNIAAIKQLCPKAIILNNGQIKSFGETSSIINEYLNENEVHCSMIDLINYKNRNGSKEAIFINAMIVDNDGKNRSEFSIGEDLSLIFEIIPQKSNIKVKFAVEIKTSDGINICNIVDSDSKFGLSCLERKTKIMIKLNDLRLYPDTYYISLWAGSLNSSDDFDYVHDCGSLLK